jgi:predicted DNA binding CopG/RHH family protein
MKEPPISVRFEDTDLVAIKAGAASEGLDLASYCRRCTVLYTREHHADFFPKPAAVAD